MPAKTKKVPSPAVPATENKAVWMSSRWVEIVLGLASLAVLIVFGYLLYQQLGENKNISRYLPEAGTIGFVQVALDPDAPDLDQLDRLYLQTGSGGLFQQHLGITRELYHTEIEPLLGDKAALGIVFNREQTPQPVVFLSFQDETKMFDSLRRWNGQEFPSEMYQQDPVYTTALPFPGYLAVVEKYIVFSPDKAVLTNVVDVYRGREPALYRNEQLVQLQKNLPPEAFLTGYIQYKNGLEIMKKTFATQKEWRDLFTLLRPLELDVANLGFSVSYQEKTGTRGWYVKTVVIGNRELFGPLASSERSLSSLEQKVTEESKWYVGGTEFLYGPQQLLQYLGQKSPDSEIVLEGLFNYYLHKYLTSTLSFSDLPGINNGEYGLFASATPETGSGGILGVFHVSNELEANQLLQKAFTDFQENSELLYTPKVRELILPDDTRGRELYLDPKEVQAMTADVQGATAHYLSITNESFSPGYLLLDGKLYLFSHYALLPSFFQSASTNNPVRSLQDMVHFQGHVKGYAQFSDIASWFPLPAQKILAQIRSMVFATQFVDNGMIMEYFLAL